MDTVVIPQLKLDRCFTLLTDAKGLYGLSTLSSLLAKISNNVENGLRLENAATRCFFIRKKLGLSELSESVEEFQYNVMTTNSVKLLDNDKLMEQTGLSRFLKRRRTRGQYKPILMKPADAKQDQVSLPLNIINNDMTSALITTTEPEVPKMAIPVLTSDSNNITSLQDIYGDLNNSIFPYFSMNSFSLEKAINDCPFLKSKVEVGGSSNQNFPTTSQQSGVNTDTNFNQNTNLFVQRDASNYFNSLSLGTCNDFTDQQQTVNNDQYISIPQFDTNLEHQHPTTTKIKPKVKTNQLKPKKYKTSGKGKSKDSTELNVGTKSATSSRDSSEGTTSYAKLTENLSGPKDDEIEENERICFNCNATSTPLWRRTPDNQRLCNACGLYHKLHNKHRPLELKKSRDAKKPPYKPRSLVCSNCHTNSASLWRRDADTGNPVCNPCGLFKRLNHRQRPAHLYTNVIKKRHRNVNNNNSCYSIPSKDQSIKEETSPPQYTTTPNNENRPVSLVQTPDNTDQLNQTNNQPQLFATSSNPFDQMHHLSNGMPFAVYSQYPANFNPMHMPLFNSLAPSLPNGFNLLSSQPYNLLNINPLINFQQAYDPNFQHLRSTENLTSNNSTNSNNPFPATTTPNLDSMNINNDPNTDQDPNKTSFSDFLSYP